jgi:hydrogenase large subunit
MATLTETRKETSQTRGNLVEMSWDPITRIVGSLGIYTKIDFAKKKVAECFSTSSMFRGYSVFMLNKDPRAGSAASVAIITPRARSMHRTWPTGSKPRL